MLTAERSTAIGWLFGGVSLSISTTWLGRRISPTNSARNASRSACVGSRPRQSKNTTSAKVV